MWMYEECMLILHKVHTTHHAVMTDYINLQSEKYFEV
jgi:hypothetical protein